METATGHPPIDVTAAKLDIGRAPSFAAQRVRPCSADRRSGTPDHRTEQQPVPGRGRSTANLSAPPRDSTHASAAASRLTYRSLVTRSKCRKQRHSERMERARKLRLVPPIRGVHRSQVGTTTRRTGSGSAQAPTNSPARSVLSSLWIECSCPLWPISLDAEAIGLQLRLNHCG